MGQQARLCANGGAGISKQVAVGSSTSRTIGAEHGVESELHRNDHRNSTRQARDWLIGGAATTTDHRALDRGPEGFVCLCGLGGGIYMVTHPTSVMSLEYLHGTWFHTWMWPGLALLFFVGLCPMLAIAATIDRRSIVALRSPVRRRRSRCMGHPRGSVGRYLAGVADGGGRNRHSHRRVGDHRSPPVTPR